MQQWEKCIQCGFRYVTEKARQNYIAEGLHGDPQPCLHCLGERTGKVINAQGYLVFPHEVGTKQLFIPKTVIEGCRPCMKNRGFL
ncbi:hypothetical protein [Brevibacillus laterosporus]|uniref:hypothetical protein n=1 Tax=Brevibacillus laterosporus TaxID=1465 RepID=UPI000CE3159A|nr:hypothetical protein [Brevibacillus laterosporus]MED1666967.1 hypothetical protein [Brevibacillus laterosporus]MED1667901.1 hypothetical protein [Brevibacillus laterosporus]MED1716819.1 hypothetical protein [Brevibacillus laterosporus]PPA89905.1 hypothetical protein C4A76_00030 [Brevibacillus laterosporus]